MGNRRSPMTPMQEEAARDRVKKAKAKVTELVDKGTKFNPAGASQHLIDRAVENSTMAAGPRDPIGRGETGSSIAARIATRESGSFSAPRPGSGGASTKPKKTKTKQPKKSKKPNTGRGNPGKGIRWF